MDWKSSLTVIPEELQGRVPITVLHLQGRINMGNADVLEQAASLAYEQGSRYFILDLKEVPSLTSAGLRAIQKIYAMTHQGSPPASHTGYLKLANASPEISQTLKLAGFDTFIGLHDSVDSAAAGFTEIGTR